MIKTGYENLAPQEATLKLLNERPEKLWKPSEAAKKLLKEGFKSGSKHFATIIYSSLKRLEEKGEVEKIEKDNRSFYKKKQNS